MIATYNHKGVQVQDYLYNDHGFLYQTKSLGDFDSLTGQQVVTSFTNFDGRGRPMEVWQIGDGHNKVRIQEYAYKENGLLDYTASLGIERDENHESLRTVSPYPEFAISHRVNTLRLS